MSIFISLKCLLVYFYFSGRDDTCSKFVYSLKRSQSKLCNQCRYKIEITDFFCSNALKSNTCTWNYGGIVLDEFLYGRKDHGICIVKVWYHSLKLKSWNVFFTFRQLDLKSTRRLFTEVVDGHWCLLKASNFSRNNISGVETNAFYWTFFPKLPK